MEKRSKFYDISAKQQESKTLKELRAMHFFSGQLDTAAAQTNETPEILATQTRGIGKIEQSFKETFKSERQKQKREITKKFIDHCRPAKKVYDRLAPFLNGYQRCQEDLKKPDLSMGQLQAMGSGTENFLKKVEESLTSSDQRFPEEAKENIKTFLDSCLTEMKTEKGKMVKLKRQKSFGPYSQTIFKNMEHLEQGLENFTQRLEEFKIDTLDQLKKNLTDLLSEIERKKYKSIKESIDRIKELSHRYATKSFEYIEQEKSFPEKFGSELYREDDPSSQEGVNPDQSRNSVELPDPSDHPQETRRQKFIRDLQRKEKLLENLWFDPVVLGDVQVDLTDLQQLHNALDTASKDVCQVLKTYEEPLLQKARDTLRAIDHTLKQCRRYVKLEATLSLKQNQEESTFHHLVSGYRSALEDTCIAYHGFIEEETTVIELLKGFATRFKQVSPTEQRDLESSSPISPQIHLEQLKSVNDYLTEKLTAYQSALQHMKIPVEEIADAQEIVDEARTYQSNHPEKIQSKMDSLSKENEQDSKPDNLIAAQEKLKELEAIYRKLAKLLYSYWDQIKQGSDSPEDIDNVEAQLHTSYEKVQEMRNDLVNASQDLEEEKQQLTGRLETWQKKYKWRPRLEELHTTYKQVLQCFFAKDSSQTDDHILENLEDSSQISLLGKVIRKEFGPEQFNVFCQYLRTLSAYVKKDPTTGEYMVQAIPKPRLIHHHCVALNETLTQFKGTKDRVEQIKDELGDEPTEGQLNHYLSDQPQYTQLEVYQHWTDDNEKVKLHLWETIPGSRPMSRKEEDNSLIKLELEKKVKILAYAEELGHRDKRDLTSGFGAHRYPQRFGPYSSLIPIYCHSFTFTDGKAGLLLGDQVESILNGFKKVWTGNVVTDQGQLPPVQVGDVIVYRQKDGTAIQHSGYVSKVEDGKIFIISKWGDFGIYEHEIAAILPIYGPYYEIYHTDRSPNDPSKARLLKRAEQPSVLVWIRKPVAPDTTVNRTSQQYTQKL